MTSNLSISTVQSIVFYIGVSSYQHNLYTQVTRHLQMPVLNADARLVVGAGLPASLTTSLSHSGSFVMFSTGYMCFDEYSSIKVAVARTAFDCVRGFGPTSGTSLCIPLANISIAGQTSVRFNV